MRGKHIAATKKVVLQLLVCSLKPMTADKRAAGMTGEKYEKARNCLQGQSRELSSAELYGNADAHILLLFLAVCKRILIMS